MKAREKAWEACRNKRKTRTAKILEEAKKEVPRLLKNSLWLVGLTLYWAEGSKEKPWGRGTPITFTNMDHEAIILFRSWCLQFFDICEDDFTFNLYIHDSRKDESSEFALWWADELNIHAEDIRLYYKKSKKTHVRHNDKDEYRGVFRLEVKRSIDLNRRISGWVIGMINSLKASYV